MNNNIKTILCAAALTLIGQAAAMAQSISGRVLTSAGTPIADAVITSPDCDGTRSAADGSFTLKGVKEGNPINIWHEGFFQRAVYLRDNNTKEVEIYMIDDSRSRYNETQVTPFATTQNDPATAGNPNLNRKDFAPGAMSVDNALRGSITGLQAINKSGMTGEGAYLQLRGVRSFVANNAPLIVINGIPYMPDENLSQIVNGYSRSLLQSLNGLDVRNITVLKGAEAAAYGSMGSNGVIMIETDQASAVSTDTKISFSAIAGTNWNNKRMPLMNANDYKGYLTDMGLTYYNNMESFLEEFTFLSDPNANRAYLYQNNTDWQDLIYRNSMSMDYLFRVEGGDNIAKYNISLGYTSDEGTLKNTFSDRYNAQINASVLVSKKFEIRANINTAYLNGQYQEQGMSLETNPILAAYRRSPLLNPNQHDIYGNVISRLSSYRFGAITNEDLYVSNPVAIINTLTGKNRQYDLNTKIQFIYTPIRNLTVNGSVGMYYNYNQEEAFIPGYDDEAIVPFFDNFGESKNTVRVGTNHTFNMYYGLNAAYKYNIGEQHKLNFNLGWQAVTTHYEYDAAFGRNTDNDFYQTLNLTNSLGRSFAGYNNKWNWLNTYAHADYTWQNTVKVGLTAAYDGASSIGQDATRMSLYPAADVVLMAKQLNYLNDLSWLDKLNIFANLSSTGNSRFANKLSRYYYTSTPFQNIAGITRGNVPNTKLKAERDRTLNVGVEASLLHNRLQLGATYYNTRATNVLIAEQVTVAQGTSPYYNNEAIIASSGVELEAAWSPIYTKDLHWTIGGNLSSLSNKVKSLGASSEIINQLDDDAEIITRVGSDPFSFYGLRNLGVFATTADANAAALSNDVGRSYVAGDVHYEDVNHDNVINDADKQVLGSATPDFFGSFFTRLEYKQFALDLTFAYSVGNKAYNAVRRITESGKDFSNQSTSMNRRWAMEGQQTDMPRVQWNDPSGNNNFSSRFVEDASYLKLRDITLSYTWDKPLLNFLLGGTAFITGQNLFCVSKYLGIDPEFSYSYSQMMLGVDYAKAVAPRSVKIGVNLKF